MEQVKKAHKKVGKKASKPRVKLTDEPKISIHRIIGRWMVSMNNDLGEIMIELDDLRTSVGRMRVAFWAMFIFQVVFTLAFLLALYGNQFLVK